MSEKSIEEKIRNGLWLTAKEEQEMLDLPNAVALVERYAQTRWRLSVKALQAMFAHPRASELVRAYQKHSFYDLPQEVRGALFELENADELVKDYVKRGKYLSPEEQVKMCKLPNAPEVVAIYIEKGLRLCIQAQLLVLDFPNAGELILNYVKCGKSLGCINNHLCSAVWARIEELPNAEEICTLYDERYCSF